jgi:hypothetical protein
LLILHRILPILPTASRLFHVLFFLHDRFVTASNDRVDEFTQASSTNTNENVFPTKKNTFARLGLGLW